MTWWYSGGGMGTNKITARRKRVKGHKRDY